MCLLSLRVSLARLVAGRGVGRYIVVVGVAEGIGERNDGGEKKDGWRMETGSDEVGVVDVAVAVAGVVVVVVVVAGAEVDVDGIEILRGSGIGGIGNGGVAAVGVVVVVVVVGGVDVDGGGVGVDEVVVVVVAAVVGGVDVEDVLVLLVDGGGVVGVEVEVRRWAEDVGGEWIEAVGGRRRAGGRWVSGAGLRERAAVAVRSDALGGQVVAEGEGGSVCAMRVSEQITELCHRASAEGRHVDVGDGVDAAEVRNGRMDRMGDVLHGG